MVGQNYAAAWKDLKKRFDRKEDLVQEYIRKFLEVPAIFNKPTFTRLRAIVDATNQMTRALPTLDVSVENWDPFIILIILTKLDEITRQEWKQKNASKSSTTFKDLLSFLELRATELQPSQSEKLNQLLRGENQRKFPKKIFQVNDSKVAKKENKLECPICGGQHRIWHCEKLKNQCAKVRTDIIKDLKMCFKCLLKHQIGECTKENCPYCDGPHNILLCYKRENDEKTKINDTTKQTFWAKGKSYQEFKPKKENPKENQVSTPTQN